MSATAPVRPPAPARRRASGATRAATGAASEAAWQPTETAAAAPKPAGLPRPHLVVVAPARTTVGLLPFVALIAALLVGGLVSVLMLHTFAAQDAFQVTAKQQRLSALNDEAQSLQQKVAADSAPTALRNSATRLGMRPSEIDHYKRLTDGRVVAVRTAVPPYVAPPTTGTPTTAGATKAGADAPGAAKAGTAKAGTAKAGTAKAGTAKTGTASTGTAKSGTTPTNPATTSTAKPGTTTHGRAAHR